MIDLSKLKKEEDVMQEYNLVCEICHLTFNLKAKSGTYNWMVMHNNETGAHKILYIEWKEFPLIELGSGVGIKVPAK